MKAVIFKKQKISISDVPIPIISEKEALVKVQFAGICSTDIELFDVVIEATGNPDGINQAILMTRPEGTIVIKTTSCQPSEIDLAQVVVNELKLVGSRCGDMAFALSFLENKRINFSPLVEAVYPLADFKNAFEHARQKGCKKILLSNSGSVKSQT